MVLHAGWDFNKGHLANRQRESAAVSVLITASVDLFETPAQPQLLQFESCPSCASWVSVTVWFPPSLSGLVKASVALRPGPESRLHISASETTHRVLKLTGFLFLFDESGLRCRRRKSGTEGLA